MKVREINSPLIRYPEFSDDWHSSRLGDYLEFKNGFNADKSQYGTGTKFINVLDIINESPITYDSIIGRVTMSEAESKNYEVKFGDILFQRSSETREEVGQSNIYLDRDTTAAFGGFVIRGAARQSYDPLFFYYLLKTESVRKDITSRSGGSTRYNIGQESLRDVRIFLPTQDEQRKIAAFLWAVDEKICDLTKQKELLLRYKKGVMQRLFRQHIRFKNDNGKDFPNWEEKRLGDIATVIMGQSPDSKSYNTTEKGVPLIQGNADIKDRRTAPRIWTSQPTKMCQPGDLLLTVRAPVGEVAKSQHRACIGRGICLIRNKQDVSSEFLFQTLLGLESKWSRIAQGSTFTAISGNDIRSLKQLFPGLAEQKKIADFLSAIDKTIELVGFQLEKSKIFRKALLQQMFI